MIWPVPQSYSRTLPHQHEPGSFWENRGDRRHCGVDIYAPEGAPVLAIDGGCVLGMGLFTSPNIIDYWNPTFFITIIQQNGIIVRYAEMDDSVLENSDIVHKGQVIGHVGRVLNAAKISDASPPYVQRLKQHQNLAMLHIEALKNFPTTIPDYSGGNSLQHTKPKCLLDPSILLPIQKV